MNFDSVRRLAAEVIPLRQAVEPIRDGFRRFDEAVDLFPHADDPFAAVVAPQFADAAASFDQLVVELGAKIADRADLTAAQRAIVAQTSESVTTAVDLIGRLKVPYRTDHARSIDLLHQAFASVDQSLLELAGDGAAAARAGAAAKPGARALPALTGQHAATLERLMSPDVGPMRWRDIESLMVNLGGKVTERAGSRISVRLNNIVGRFHRPHPSPEASSPMVRSARSFLIEAGVVSK